MNWDAIGAVGEVVGALAVVATLFYLVIQVRQSRQATEANTRAIRGNASWDAENVFAQRNLGIAGDTDHAELVQRIYATNADISSFSESERIRVVADTTSTLQMVQAQYFLWMEGSLPDEIWAHRSTWARRFIMLPIVNVVWEDLKTEDFFVPGFVATIEAIPPSKSAGLSTVSYTHLTLPTKA